MIPRTNKSLQTQVSTCDENSWQQELSQLITDPEQLLNELELPLNLLDQVKSSSGLFALRCTRSFLQRMKKGDLNDPLLKQILPLAPEQRSAPGYINDPLMESKYTPVKGLIHKYQGRVLLVAATQCAINCRYCFRRHFPYDEHKNNQQDWQAALNYVASDSSIKEVILSGGDPLVLNDRQINRLIEGCDGIEHLKRFRIHSRLPIVLPSRITDSLLTTLTRSRLQLTLVIHSNHAQEIDEQVGESLSKLRNAGITLLNQSVLLNNINNSASELINLSERLNDFGVLPYYLHLLDKVNGTAHFDVDENAARKLLHQMMAELPGYLVPKLVREVAGEANKVPVIL